MSTWPNRGASGGPCGGLEERKTEANAVRPTRSDSSQQASSKPGAVQSMVLSTGKRAWRMQRCTRRSSRWAASPLSNSLK